jgi:PAS domain S-box-containing protein
MSGNNGRQEKQNSSVRLFILTILSIVISHFLIGILVNFLPHTTLLTELILDTILLSIIIFPIIYFFVFRPLIITINERLQSKAALRNSEERFRSLAQSAVDAIVTSDNKGRISGWNNGAEKAFGYMEAEIKGKELSQIIPQEYIKSHIIGMDRVNAGGEKHVLGHTVELYGLHKNGNSFPIELSLSEWETSEGKFFTGIIRDITRRKRAELEGQILYEISQGVTKTDNLDELFELIHQSLTKVLYAENIFVAFHNEKTGLFSFPYYIDKIDPKPLPTAMGKSCTAYVYRTAKPLLLSAEVFLQLKQKNEVELVGSPSPSWIGIPLQTPLRVIGVLVLQHYEKENTYSERDVNFLSSVGSQIAITIEHKIDEEEIQLKNELLHASNLEKDKFFSIIAHDLRGPLSAFVSVTQMLTENVKSMTTNEIEDISISMKEDASNIYSLLENLLEWSRLKRGLLVFEPVKFNLNESINSSTRVLSGTASGKGIKLNINVPENLEVVADNHMIGSIVRNLVSNAVKFSFSGGTIEVSAYLNPDTFIEVRISDSGIGMSAELKSKLFKMNENTGRKGTKGEASSGLGLLLCKEFVEKHNGKIWAESEDGNGTSFYFTIP